MILTGSFNDRMKEFFNATEGAYTVFTAEEYRKSTYNVKAVMRNIITNRLGTDFIPRAGDGSNETIRFNVCEYDKAYVQDDHWTIPCKYCKPNRNEVSIYFNKNTQIIPCGCKPFDFWFVFFRNGIDEPFIGFMNSADWSDSFGISTEPAPQPILVPKYSCPVNNMNPQEVTAPVLSSPPQNTTSHVHTSAALTPETSAQKAKRNKITGNRAEEIVLEIEKKKLTDAGHPELCAAIDHIASHTDGTGYDIRSYDINEEDGKTIIREIYIEVKGTSAGIDTPFYVTRNEVEFSQSHKDSYYIYRVYNLSETSTDVSYYKLKGAITDNFELQPDSYIVTGTNQNQ